MLRPWKNLPRFKIELTMAVLAVSITACSSPSVTTTDTSSPASSPSPQATNTPQTTDIGNSTTIPGVKSVEEVEFKPADPNFSYGYFDGVNGSTATSHEVSKSEQIQVGGWAFLPEQGRPADSVLITSGDNNSLVAVVPVNLERKDVVKVLKKQAYQKTGWSGNLDPATLPSEKVILKAWAYNSASKEAIQLANTHVITIVN